MFTGIVAELGRVVAFDPATDSAQLTVAAASLGGVTVGESVAVNGVCLTAVEIVGDQVRADVMGETLARSALADLVPGAPVNLERPVTPVSLLGGHVVQGHVDGIATVTARQAGDGWETVVLSMPASLLRYVVAKGSITLDGVSLTVMDLGEDWLSVGLIPETLRRTTLGVRAVGDRVNVEVDVLAKYVERLLAARVDSEVTAL